MTPLYAIGLIIGISLAVYLFVALLKPEKFS
jgi:K+-transporting ATPase KdpF subunit